MTITIKIRPNLAGSLSCSLVVDKAFVFPGKSTSTSWNAPLVIPDYTVAKELIHLDHIVLSFTVNIDPLEICSIFTFCLLELINVF